MSDRTKIEWTDATWNPADGCTPADPETGCKNCYAARIARRFWGGRPFSDVRFHRERLDMPLHWRRPRRVFVCSMGDLFHPLVQFPEQDAVFGSMLAAGVHEYAILTKRPEQMKMYFTNSPGGRMISNENWFRESVTLGVSVSNQAEVDERIPILLQIPAARRIVSIEPMLGPVVIDRIGAKARWEHMTRSAVRREWADLYDGTRLDGVIVGGETGPGARPMHPDWVRSVRNQCQAARVPFFFKSWGEWLPSTDVDISHPLMWEDFDSNSNGRVHKLPDDAGAAAMLRVGKKQSGRLLDGRTWDEWPER